MNRTCKRAAFATLERPDKPSGGRPAARAITHAKQFLRRVTRIHQRRLGKNPAAIEHDDVKQMPARHLERAGIPGREPFAPDAEGFNAQGRPHTSRPDEPSH
jgi:hypothetical protein